MTFDVPPPPQVGPDTTAATAYDTVWATTEVPAAEPLGTERFMLAEDKLPVVLAVVLVIWFGLLLYLFRTDRTLARLERRMDGGIPDDATTL